MYNVEEKVNGKQGECIYLARRCKMISCLVQPIASIPDISAQKAHTMEKIISDIQVGGSVNAGNISVCSSSDILEIGTKIQADKDVNFGDISSHS
jgi:hypothetical protein